jgi:ATP-dependent Clp protease ATP-binding subunit ClpA
MERFTQRTRRILTLAQEAAERLQHDQITPGHVLLALTHEKESIAYRVLNDLRVDQPRVEDVLPPMVQPGHVPNAKLALAPGTKKLLELAVENARHLEHHYIEPEHLLLGLVSEDEDNTSQLFKRLNVNPNEIRTRTLRILQDKTVEIPQAEPEKPAPEKPSAVSAVNSWQLILRFAAQEAANFRHRAIGTDHVLIGVLQAKYNDGAQVLAALGVTLEQVRELVGQKPPSEDFGQAATEFTEELRIALGLAHETTFFSPLNPQAVTADLLIGILNRADSAAVDVLKRLNVDPETVKQTIYNTFS